MKTFTAALFLFILLAPTLSHGNWEETVAYIESLLAQNKKVAVLVIDMQEWFRADFPGNHKGVAFDTSPSNWEIARSVDHIIEHQANLIGELASKEGIYIINVTYKDSGATLPELLFQMHKNQRLKRFIRTKDNAFASVSVPDNASRKEPGELIFGKLKDSLSKEGIEDLFLTGCFDSSCIFETAEGALKKGFSVVIDNEMNIPIRKSAMQHISQDEYKSISEKSWEKLAQKYPKLKIINKEFDQTQCCTIL